MSFLPSVQMSLSTSAIPHCYFNSFVFPTQHSVFQSSQFIFLHCKISSWFFTLSWLSHSLLHLESYLSSIPSLFSTFPLLVCVKAHTERKTTQFCSRFETVLLWSYTFTNFNFHVKTLLSGSLELLLKIFLGIWKNLHILC